MSAELKFIEQGDVDRARGINLSAVPSEIERPLAITLEGDLYSNFAVIPGNREHVLSDPRVQRSDPFRLGIYPDMSGYTGQWFRVGSVTDGEIRLSNLGRSVAEHV